jgi:hypothetical protein
MAGKWLSRNFHLTAMLPLSFKIRAPERPLQLVESGTLITPVNNNHLFEYNSAQSQLSDETSAGYFRVYHLWRVVDISFALPCA